MRRYAAPTEPPPAGAPMRGDWSTIRSLLPYRWAFAAIRKVTKP